MKLIEVVVLMGAHCISPIQSTEAVTEAAKVQCAVVVEKDSQQGTVRVVPAGAARHPQVVAVIDRFEAGLPPGTRIEPAFAPPGGTAVPLRKPVTGSAAAPQAPIAEPPAAPLQQAETSEPAPQRMAAIEEDEGEKPAAVRKPVAPKKKATAAQKKPKKTATQKAVQKKPMKTAAKIAKPASQCAGSAVPRWYTTEDGRKKYRCVKAGSKTRTQTIDALR